jgi:hypothetical protein
MRLYPIAAAAAIALAPSVCLAQASTTTGAVSGAAVGAVVGGPVGAVVGGIAGGAIGAAAEPPPEVRSYVVTENVPSVQVDENVVVGEPLPATVVLRPIPRYTEYRYAIVNHERVIVDPRTRKVIQIIE